MPETTTAYIKGRELPSALIKKLKIDPAGLFKITIEPRDREPDEMEAAFEILDEIHEKMKDEAPEEIEALIDDAVKTTRSHA